MSDLLVPLYYLPEISAANNFVIRKTSPWESKIIIDWVESQFGTQWASEVSVAVHQQPSKCLIVTDNDNLMGFACFDTTALGFFGPTGVCEKARGKGFGKALLMHSMHAMKESGYGYAIIGDAGPIEFYRKEVGAIEIKNSTPGIYHPKVKTDD